jgi:hypothetical protein
MTYDKIVILKKTSSYTYGVFSEQGHCLTEFRADSRFEAEGFAKAFMSSWYSVLIRTERDVESNREK